MLEKQKISQLPDCIQRLGRVWDDENGKYRAVITCGGKIEVDLNTCQSCGGITTPLLIKCEKS